MGSIMTIVHHPVAVAFAATPKEDVFDSVQTTTTTQLNVTNRCHSTAECWWTMPPQKVTRVRSWLLLDSSSSYCDVSKGIECQTSVHKVSFCWNLLSCLPTHCVLQIISIL